MEEEKDPLRARLFGYGLPYRVQLEADGGIRVLSEDDKGRPRSLGVELYHLAGNSAGQYVGVEGEWFVSMPFGHCAIDGHPREHLVVHHASEAYLDALFHDGPRRYGIPGRSTVLTITIEPGTIVRVRARAQEGKRVLVAFQTEDWTPLHGNAMAFSLHGGLPDGDSDWPERLRRSHQDFQAMIQVAQTGRFGWYREIMADFFERMQSSKNWNNAAIQRALVAAREHGSYDVTDQGALFARQQALLTPEVLVKIYDSTPGYYRFPGMFGAVAPLMAAYEAHLQESAPVEALVPG